MATKIPGVAITVGDGCIGCGTCVKICFVHVTKVVDGLVIITESCRGRGRCVTTCFQNVIALTIVRTENLHDSIINIESLVDVT